jgi:molecular chaperone DnaJ
MITIGECPRCHGAGKRILERCPTCNGKGRLETVERIEVSVPPGVEDGAVLRVPRHGMPGRGGGPAGDLYVHIEFEASDHLRREGEDVHSEVTVPLLTALVGGEVTVPTVDGEAVVKIPPGTQPETQLRLRGRGFPRLRGSGRGDQIVTTHVELPRSLGAREREQLRQLLGEPGGAGGRKESFFRRRGS